MSLEYITRHVAGMKQRYTQYAGRRPYGISCLLTGFDDDGTPHLYQTDPAGVYTEWKANAIGRNAKTVREFLEKNFPNEGVESEHDTIKLDATPPLDNKKVEVPLNNTVEATDTEEEKREQQMDKRVQNLLSLFPQKDPEYLRAKNNEFGLDSAGVTAFETWVLEVVENGGKDLPSREDYDKRKKVIDTFVLDGI